MTGPYRRDRRLLVERLRQAGIRDLAVLHAFDRIPRHRFVPEAVRHRAYEIAALPIGHEQTISRPTVHATHLSLAELDGDERVLEVGTGSGFQTALLALLAGEVYSIERVEPLAERARQRLSAMEDVEDVHVRTGDGSRGWPAAAPFDAILVGAAAPSVPAALEGQLAEGGRLVVPVGDDEQRLLLIRRREGELEREEIERSRFVPLVGEEGW